MAPRALDYPILRFGRPYQVPAPVCTALEQVFRSPVQAVKVVEYSLHARVHFGMTATTRPHLILIASSGDGFVSNPELLLHEYFHVIKQWNTGALTRWRYLLESAQRGYWDNRFEKEAREFAAAAVEPYSAFLRMASREPARRTPDG